MGRDKCTCGGGWDHPCECDWTAEDEANHQDRLERLAEARAEDEVLRHTARSAALEEHGYDALDGRR